MDLNSVLILEANNIDFNDLITIKKIECYRSAIICLIQTNREVQNPNKKFFTAMVKKLAEIFLFENSNPDLFLLLQTVTSSQTINADDYPLLRSIPIEILESIHKKINDFLEVRTKEKFITVVKYARMLPNLLRTLDVSHFEIEIEFYDFENNLDIETFFNKFPEYRRYMQDCIQFGQNFVYKF